METPEIKKSYWSVTPANVRYSKNIVDGAKLLYGEIGCLCNEKGFCWASNEYFANLYGNGKSTISKWISALAKEEFIYIDMTSGRRKIFLAQIFNPADITEKGELPPVEKLKKEKKKRKETVGKFTAGDLELAELLFSKVVYNFPTFQNKTVKISDWAEDIRKLREIDKASVEQIRFMILWVQGGEIAVVGKPPRKFEPHDFWSRNVMSAAKLRKHWFENLVPQLQDALKKNIKKNAVTQL